MHTSVIVFVNTEYENIEDMLDYYAYEPICNDGLEFMEELTKEEAQKRYNEEMKDVESWKKNLQGWREATKMTLAEYFNIHEGYTEDEDGNFGYLSNPEGRWDWYVIGGRWQNSIVLKSGEEVNDAPISEIDWEAMRKGVTEYIGNEYDTIKNRERGFINDIKEGETKEQYTKRKDGGMTTHYWNVLEGGEGGWTETHGEEGNNIIQQYIDEYKDDKNIHVYIVDCHS